MTFSLSGTFVLALAFLAGVLAVRASSKTLLLAGVAAAAVPWTLLGVAGVPDPVTRMPAAVLVILAVVALLAGRQHDLPSEIGRGRAALIVAGLAVGFMLIRTLASSDPGVVGALIPWVTGLALFRALLRGHSAKLVSGQQLLMTLVLAKATVALWDLTERVSHFAPLPSMAIQTTPVLEKGVVFARFSGTLGDYELLSEISALCCAAAILFALTVKGSGRRLFWIAVAVILLGEALATDTRSGLVVIAIVISVFYILMRKWLPLLAGAVSIAVAISAGAGGSITFQRFATINFSDPFSRIINRSTIWAAFGQATDGQLWTLTGHGLNYPIDRLGLYPHSLYYALLYQGGVVGLLALLVPVACIIGLLLWRAWRGGETASALAAAIGVAFLVDQSKIEFVRLDSYVMTVVVLFGVLVCTLRDQPQATPPRLAGNVEVRDVHSARLEDGPPSPRDAVSAWGGRAATGLERQRNGQWR